MSSSVDHPTTTHHDTHISTDGADEITVNAVEIQSDQTSSGPTEKHEGHEEYTELDALLDALNDDEKPQEDVKSELNQSSASKPAPEQMLQTNPYHGLTDVEVQQRKKQFGLNEMSEEKENMLLKFLMFFVGPIQCVMEVS